MEGAQIFWYIGHARNHLISLYLLTASHLLTITTITLSMIFSILSFNWFLLSLFFLFICSIIKYKIIKRIINNQFKFLKFRNHLKMPFLKRILQGKPKINLKTLIILQKMIFKVYKVKMSKMSHSIIKTKINKPRKF